MNFILLSDYYHPIIKSGSIIIGDLTAELVRKGHKVTVVTFVSDQKDKFQDDTEKNIRVIRIRVASRKYGMAGRLIAEYSYSSKIVKTLQNIEGLEYDAIICYSPSIFYGDAIRWLKNNRIAKAYLIVRDIFPKWVVDAGIIKKGLLYRYFKYVELKLYNIADFIGIESQSDIDYFVKYVESQKVEVLHNWGAPIGYINNSLELPVQDEQKIKILYGGNMGEPQDLLSLVKSIDVSILNDRAILMLIGSGNQTDAIQEVIRNNGIKDIVLLPKVDRETYLAILAEADVGLVSLSKKLASNNFPLKMMGYMQLSKPILASVNKGNEIIDIINEYDIGLVSMAGDSEAFNSNLSLIVNDQKLREHQGDNSLRLFNNRFTVQAAASQICSHFF